MGASTAFHLAERGIETLVLDPNGPAGGSTARSGALVRCHYPTSLEADLAWESLTEYFEPWGERVGGGCGFTRTGFAYLAGEDRVEALRHNVNLQRKVNVQTELMRPEDLAGLDPSLDLDGVALAAYEPRGGYADPTATTVGFLEAARERGATFGRRRVTGLRVRGGRVSGVETERHAPGGGCSGAGGRGVVGSAGGGRRPGVADKARAGPGGALRAALYAADTPHRYRFGLRVLRPSGRRAGHAHRPCGTATSVWRMPNAGTRTRTVGS